MILNIICVGLEWVKVGVIQAKIKQNFRFYNSASRLGCKML